MTEHGAEAQVLCQTVPGPGSSTQPADLGVLMIFLACSAGDLNPQAAAARFPVTMFVVQGFLASVVILTQGRTR